jgi:Na+/H+ antiporter NhaC
MLLQIVAEIFAIIIAFLIELAIWTGLGLYLGLRSIVSERPREKLKEQWTSGWEGKVFLVFSAIFWLAIIVLAVYFWCPFMN